MIYSTTDLNTFLPLWIWTLVTLRAASYNVQTPITFGSTTHLTQHDCISSHRSLAAIYIQPAGFPLKVRRFIQFIQLQLSLIPTSSRWTFSQLWVWSWSHSPKSFPYPFRNQKQRNFMATIAVVVQVYPIADFQKVRSLCRVLFQFGKFLRSWQMQAMQKREKKRMGQHRKPYFS